MPDGKEITTSDGNQATNFLQNNPCGGDSFLPPLSVPERYATVQQTRRLKITMFCRRVSQTTTSPHSRASRNTIMISRNALLFLRRSVATSAAPFLLQCLLLQAYKKCRKEVAEERAKNKKGWW